MIWLEIISDILFLTMSTLPAAVKCYQCFVFVYFNLISQINNNHVYCVF